MLNAPPSPSYTGLRSPSQPTGRGFTNFGPFTLLLAPLLASLNRAFLPYSGEHRRHLHGVALIAEFVWFHFLDLIFFYYLFFLVIMVVLLWAFWCVSPFFFLLFVSFLFFSTLPDEIGRQCNLLRKFSPLYNANNLG